MGSIAISILSTMGLVVSAYLLYGQKAHKELVCLIGHDCDVVVKSAYGKTFGIENTILGILYYGCMLLVAVFSFPIPAIFLLIISAVAGLFSIYLIYIQAFVLKKWCDYCVLSALINWALFALIFMIA